MIVTCPYSWRWQRFGPYSCNVAGLKRVVCVHLVILRKLQKCPVIVCIDDTDELICREFTELRGRVSTRELTRPDGSALTSCHRRSRNSPWQLLLCLGQLLDTICDFRCTD